ncbi:hypothetical protein LGQ02_15020 [Bacillus shivajii]|uniref:hypothetical protein n=1 Tax=Bacillus shivajii TaxID=1983719 RepID=UPI001CFC007F|nr:hypothetical protein [Bacillus shivajii]UCZ52148.1 hypothetical protein LGQ02_15020 [Bacillus shivajii]
MNLFVSHDIYLDECNMTCAILHVDPQIYTYEFSSELGEKHPSLNTLALSYIRHSIPNTKVKLIKVVVGSLLLTSIITTPLSISSATSAEELPPGQEDADGLPPGHTEETENPPHTEEDGAPEHADSTEENELPPGHTDDTENPEHAGEPGTPDHAEGGNDQEKGEDFMPFLGPIEIGDFSAVTLNGQIQQTVAQINSFPIYNEYPLTDGWHITVKAEPLTNQHGHRLPPGSLNIEAPVLSNIEEHSSAASELKVRGGAIDLNDGLKLVSASAGGGIGSFLVSFGSHALGLTLEPEHTMEGTYSTTIIVNITAGP